MTFLELDVDSKTYSGKIRKKHVIKVNLPTWSHTFASGDLTTICIPSLVTPPSRHFNAACFVTITLTVSFTRVILILHILDIFTISAATYVATRAVQARARTCYSTEFQWLSALYQARYYSQVPGGNTHLYRLRMPVCNLTVRKTW